MSELLVGALLWAGLVIFFLTPFKKEGGDSSWKDSLWKIVSKSKVVLVPLMLGITLFIIWLYHADIIFYYEIHGEPLTFDPMKRAWFYMGALVIYTLLLCFFVIYKNIKRLA